MVVRCKATSRKIKLGSFQIGGLGSLVSWGYLETVEATNDEHLFAVHSMRSILTTTDHTPSAHPGPNERCSIWSVFGSSGQDSGSSIPSVLDDQKPGSIGLNYRPAGQNDRGRGPRPGPWTASDLS
jgi:hypothetical protein